MISLLLVLLFESGKRHLQEDERGEGRDVSFPNDSHRNKSSITLKVLDCTERRGQKYPSNEQADNVSVVPSHDNAAPFQSKNVADKCRHCDHSATHVELEEYLSGACFRGLGECRRLKENEQDGKGRCAHRKIDVKAVQISWARTMEMWQMRFPSSYHHRQLSLSVKTPPSKGPATLAILKTAPTRPRVAGCFAGAMMKATIV